MLNKKSYFAIVSLFSIIGLVISGAIILNLILNYIFLSDSEYLAAHFYPGICTNKEKNCEEKQKREILLRRRYYFKVSFFRSISFFIVFLVSFLVNFRIWKKLN